MAILLIGGAKRVEISLQHLGPFQMPDFSWAELKFEFGPTQIDKSMLIQMLNLLAVPNTVSACKIHYNKVG